MIPLDPEVSIVVVAYNSAKVLPECLLSISRQHYASHEVIVVDNASQDNSSQIAREVFPSARTIRLPENLGYGAGCNAGAAIARGRYLIFLNPDTVVESNWIEPLISELAADSTLGAVTPKIVLMHDPTTINACGNDVQFLGFPSCHLLGVKASQIQHPGEVTSISGAAFAMDRKLFELLGGFDPRFFMYLEDTDLSWRLRLAGYKCRYIPQSVVRHHYAPSFSANKYYYLERNRYRLLLKNLAMRTLIALFPALVLAETSGWGYATLRGGEHLRAKWQVCVWLFREWRNVRQETLAARRAQRRVTDADLLKACSADIAYGVAYDGWIVRLATAGFNPVYNSLRSLAVILLKI